MHAAACAPLRQFRDAHQLRVVCEGAPNLAPIAAARCAGRKRAASEVGGVRLEASSRFCGPKKPIMGPQFTGTCVRHGGVRFHRIRDLKQYHFDSIPPTPRGLGCRTVSFHNFESQNFKLSVSNPKKQICCLFVRTVSNFKLPESRPQKQTWNFENWP